jgi:hypothetical protein
MNYEELCKYVFSEERVDWNLRSLKNRRKPLVLARHISIYLGNWFFPMMTDDDLIKPFNQDRCTTFHAIKNIKNLLFSDKDLRRRIDKYLRILGRELRAGELVKDTHNDIERSIECMHVVAQTYCELTGYKLVKNL